MTYLFYTGTQFSYQFCSSSGVYANLDQFLSCSDDYNFFFKVFCFMQVFQYEFVVSASMVYVEECVSCASNLTAQVL